MEVKRKIFKCIFKSLIIGMIINSCSLLFSQQVYNLGSQINTNEDEFLPAIVGNTLYFGRTYFIGSSPIQQYKVYKSINSKSKFSTPQIDNRFQSSIFENHINPLIVPTAKYLSLQRFMMHTFPRSGRLLKDEPKKYHDFHPAMSNDGSFMVFASDRKGIYESNDTTTDLFIIYKMEKNEWTEPVNLGSQINSHQNEITPFIDKTGNLYFASKNCCDGNWNYDIYKAEFESKGKWKKPVKLDYPLNTDYNETGPIIIGDSLIFASDRPGGCGNPKGYANYDLYVYNLPIVVSNELEYQNPKVNISSREISKEYLEINFTEYKVPFFITGYYYPNTKKNLGIIKQKFQSGIYGRNTKTNYIKNPDREDFDYQKGAIAVENALNDAKEQILRVLSEFNKNQDETINIKITGFSDSRTITPNSIYDGESIHSANPVFNVSSGKEIDNILLSQLRAFYTCELIKNSLENNRKYKEIMNRIHWTIEGKGTDNRDELSDLEKRRVIVTISSEAHRPGFIPLKTQLNDKHGLNKFGLGNN